MADIAERDPELGHGSSLCERPMRGVEGFDFGDGSLEGAGLGHKEVFGDGGVAFGVGAAEFLTFIAEGK